MLVAAIVRRVLEHLVLGGDALLRWLRRHHLVVLSLLLGSGHLLLRPLNILMYEHLSIEKYFYKYVTFLNHVF